MRLFFLGGGANMTVNENPPEGETLKSKSASHEACQRKCFTFGLHASVMFMFLLLFFFCVNVLRDGPRKKTLFFFFLHHLF